MDFAVKLFKYIAAQLTVLPLLTHDRPWLFWLFILHFCNSANAYSNFILTYSVNTHFRQELQFSSCSCCFAKTM